MVSLVHHVSLGVKHGENGGVKTSVCAGLDCGLDTPGAKRGAAACERLLLGCPIAQARRQQVQDLRCMCR